MIHLTIRRVAFRIPLRTPLLLALILSLVAGLALAAAIGDQVELKATHQAGVPFHQAPRGTNNFQRIPNGLSR
jgi:hypothetical protein